MNQIEAGMLAEAIDKYLDEYLFFYGLCIDKRHIEEDEIPMLWKAWCSGVVRE